MTLNFTQKELAFLLGLPITSISRWENGGRIPGVYYAIGLSVATHRLVDELFSDYRNEWKDIIRQRLEALDSYKKQSKSKSWESNQKSHKIITEQAAYPHHLTKRI